MGRRGGKSHNVVSSTGDMDKFHLGGKERSKIEEIGTVCEIRKQKQNVVVTEREVIPLG